MLRTLFQATACVLLVSPTSDVLSVQTTEGESIRRTIQFSVERSLESMTQLADGEDQSAMFGEDRSHDIENSVEVIVLDEIQAVEAGQATQFLRTYETVAGETASEQTFGDQSNSSEHELVSEVEGEQIQFTLEEDEWVPAVADGSSLGDEYLGHLVASMDLAELLPEEEVTKGDEWEADLALMRRLSSPGGELGLHPDSMDDYEMLETKLEPENSGTISVTHGGASEDNEKLVVLNIAIDMESVTDLAESMRARMDNAPDDQRAMMPEIEAALRTTAAEGNGEALWDTEKGRLVSLSFEVEVTETMERKFRITPPSSDEILIESVQVMAGTATGEITVETL